MLALFYDTNGVPQPVDVTDGSVHTLATGPGGGCVETSITQNVISDTNNSSIDNLVAANSYTFTGVGTSTLGVVGLQWGLKTDQNATVYIEESNDNINWDISYSFNYIASKGGRGETVQASLAYWRIRVVLSNSTDTTYFRLSGVLCPIAVPLPSELSSDGRLKSESTLSGKENTERHVWVNPTDELSVSPVYRMVGTAFDNTVLDPNFWTPTLVNGTITQSGAAVHLQTSAAINSSATYDSKRKARFVAGSAQLFVGAYNFEDAGIAGNVRRFGPYDDDNGFYFELDGTTFSIGSRKATADTLVGSGSFNGNYGSTWTPTAGAHYKYSIEFTPIAAIWYVNSQKLHSIKGSHLSDTMTLPIRMENVNTTNNTDIELECDGTYIARQGELHTNPTSKYIYGTSVTVCKYGAGILNGIIISAVSNGADINIYDGLLITDPVIWESGNLPAKTEPLAIPMYGLPFSDGLTIEIKDSNAGVLAVYE